MDTNKLASILAKSKKVMNKTDEMQNSGKINQGGNGSVPTCQQWVVTILMKIQ